MERLDPLALPLRGVQLIEASAGTGKTYNIVAIYLRLLVEREIDISRILVVTFTNAATEELRARIRKRLREAVAAFRSASIVSPNATPKAEPFDPFLDQLVMQRPREERLRIAHRLEEALTRMDEAAVFTIHGFCQRMLQEFAFECGVPFDWEVIPDEEDLRRDVINDFWRTQLIQADPSFADWMTRTWSGPEDLLRTLDGFRGTARPKFCRTRRLPHPWNSGICKPCSPPFGKYGRANGKRSWIFSAPAQH